MKIRIGSAHFDAEQAKVEVNGHRIGVQSKLPLIREGLCSLQGNEDSAELLWSLNDTLSPKDATLILCSQWPLVELAARYWRWSNDEANDPWAPCTVQPIKEDGAARAAWQEHIDWIKENR